MAVPSRGGAGESIPRATNGSPCEESTMSDAPTTAGKLLPPINFHRWIDEHRDQLQPPVCNKRIFPMGEFIVMVVGGPNTRRDYHDDPGEELFYQVEGAMVLKTVQDGQVVDITIGEGEMFLLPPHVPHSPQRFADTIGLVVERPRMPGEQDGFLWYCDACGAQVHGEYFELENIETQLAPLFARVAADEALRTCSQCGTVQTP
jgi:3-hydroxyanthranilate 3,4-dioxygenase